MKNYNNLKIFEAHFHIIDKNFPLVENARIYKNNEV
jgi:hypothetical protein